MVVQAVVAALEMVSTLEMVELLQVVKVSMVVMEQIVHQLQAVVEAVLEKQATQMVVLMVAMAHLLILLGVQRLLLARM
jgi:hypothetical protein